MNQAARELGVSAPMVMSNFATSTLADLAQALDELAGHRAAGRRRSGPAARRHRALGPGVLRGARRGAPPARVAGSADGEWQVFASPGHPLARALASALRAAQLGDGVAALPAGRVRRGTRRPDARGRAGRAGAPPDLPLRHRSRRARCRRTGQDAAPRSPARATHRDHAPAAAPGCPRRAPRELADAIVADVAATAGFSEVHYDAVGQRAGCPCCGRSRTSPTAPRRSRSRRATCCWSAAAGRASPPNARSRSPGRRARR